MPSTAYHCDLAWLGGDEAVADVLVEVEDERISGITVGTDAPAGATRLAGLTLPGFANAHSHAFHRALRGRTQAGTGSFWTWREQMYSLAAILEPDSYERLARAVFAEMVLAGVSCVGEFHYLHHGAGGRQYDDPNAMGRALMNAASDAGLRMTLLDTCYLHGGIGRPLDEVQRRFGDGDVHRWVDRVDALRSIQSPTVRIGAAIHSVRAVDPDGIGVVAAWARDRGVPLHAHVSEQPAENEQCAAAHGCTPTALLARWGALGPLSTAVHATHLAEDDVALLGASGTSVCLCPTTERDLADGIGPARRLALAGAPLTLGSDSHAVIDLLEEARLVELHERLATSTRGSHDAPSLLRAATDHGHGSLGWPEAGRLEVGALADLVSVRLDSVRTAGAAAATAMQHVVFAGAAPDVHHVVIGGRVIVSEGRHRSIDVAAELHTSISATWASA